MTKSRATEETAAGSETVRLCDCKMTPLANKEMPPTVLPSKLKLLLTTPGMRTFSSTSAIASSGDRTTGCSSDPFSAVVMPSPVECQSPPLPSPRTWAKLSSTSVVGRMMMLPVSPAKSTTTVALLPISGVRIGIPVKAMAGNPNAIACKAAARNVRRTM